MKISYPARGGRSAATTALSALTLMVATAFVTPAALAQEGAGGEAANTSEETYKNWRVRCEEPQDGGQRRCFMFQNLVMKETQRQLLNFAIAFPSDEADEPTAVVMVPLGVSLPAGLGLQITEDQEPAKVAYQHCIAIGCRAVMPLNDQQIADMKAGTEAQVLFADGTGRAVKVPLSLSGFTAAFEDLVAKR